MKEATSDLPAHDAVVGLTRTIELWSLVAAAALVLANIAHAFTAGLLLHWWSPLVVAHGGPRCRSGLWSGALDR